MSYKHGVSVFEEETPLQPMRKVESQMPVIVGVAPIEGFAAADQKINEPVLCFSFPQFVEQFGWSDDSKYTLCLAAEVFFRLYSVGPVVFINVYDPAVHINGIEDVDENDIIGGVDVATGERTGLELVDTVFTKFGKVPGQVLASGYSHTPAVGIYVAAKAGAVSGMFPADGVVDIEVDYFTEAPDWKETNGYVYPELTACVGTIVVGDKEYPQSLHAAALKMLTDSKNEDTPGESPSNKSYKMTGFKIGGKEVTLAVEDANYLNSQGLVTALNFDGGWKMWGNETTAYPSNTDVKDRFIPNRSFANWLAKTLILSYWSKVDGPINKRRIQNQLDSAGVFLNGLESRGKMLGGRVEFLEDDNPVTDILDGSSRFRVSYASATPGKDIVFINVYDPSYIANLF